MTLIVNKKNNITKNKKPDANSLTLTHQEFSGPIPPPVILEQYCKILPDAPERIISMAEIQQKHENKTVKKALDGEIYIKKYGQIYGFLLVSLIASLSAYALFLDHEKFAIMGMVFVAAPLVKIFILGSKNHQ